VAKNFLSVITHLISSITTAHTDNVLKDYGGITAFTMLGDTGTVDPQKVQEAITKQEEMMKDWDTEMRAAYGPSLNVAISCGQSAAAFCALFFGEERRVALKNECKDIEALKLVVADNQPKLIRIDIGSHSYVIEQIAADKPLANVYQSNIAVYGYVNDKGCTIQDFLLSYPNPVDLVAHLDKVKEVGTQLPCDKRYEVYKELYVTKGFIARNDEHKIVKGFEEAYKAEKLDGPGGQLQIKRITWAMIDTLSENRAYDNSRVILGYRTQSQSELDKIWQQMK
jgi:hypothetical protein